MQWTSEQLQAIDTRKANLLVSAAAGSGKTALLIERIRRMIIDEKTDVDKLLVLTFTRAAAAEMKERLNQALLSELEKEDADTAFVLKQINQLPSASISTLHAFCNTVVRDYFQEGGVDPEFVLGNETELSLMRQEAMETVFETMYQSIPEDGETAFSRLVDAYTDNRSDARLKQLVDIFYDFLATQPEPDDWCESALKDLQAKTVFDSRWGQSLKEMARTELTGADALYEKAIALCQEDDALQKAATILREEKINIAMAIDALEEDYDFFRKKISNMTFQRFVLPHKLEEDLKKAIKALRDEAKKILTALSGWLPEREETALEQLCLMREPMENLIHLTKEYADQFKKMKEARGMLDFNDLEQITLKILDNPAVAQELRERYEEVFLDEYQDTNDMQEAIIQKIVRSDNYFMVGDVKQSIYRFRLADPTIFIEKYHRFKADGSTNRLVLLNRNFRSCQGVIDSVNTVFETVMRGGLGEVEYNDDARLYKGLSAEGSYQKTQVCLLDQQQIQVSDFQDSTEAEAYFIASSIQRQVGKPFFDTKNGVERLLTYRDIGVLMRAVANRGEIFARIFTEMGIPVYFDGAAQYYDTPEMTVMLNLLSLIDNHHQDLPLLSVMTSPIGNFSAADCSAIRMFQKEGSFFSAAENYMTEREDILSDKLRKFYSKLRSWQQASQMFSIDEFLWKIYLESGYYYFVAALPGGKQRTSNLRVLLKRATDYKQTTLHGLFSFIRFIERMKKHHYDMSPPGILSENENVVRITTIHKSKGLEFPVVFLAGSGRRFNKLEKNNDVLLHKEFGICPKYIDLTLRGKTPTLASIVCKEKGAVEKLSEEMRLLYVAMTRARERLIITGVIDQPEKQLDKWKNASSVYHYKQAQSFLDWIMPAVLKNNPIMTEVNDHVQKIESHCFDVLVYKKWDPADVKNEREFDIAKNTLIESSVEAEVNRRMDYVYPHTKTALPSKMSVTALKQLRSQSMHLPDIPECRPVPQFMMDEKIAFTPAEKGTALHFIMQNLNINGYRMADQPDTFLENERQRMIDSAMIEKALADTVDVSYIRQFFKSDLGKRLLASQHIYRERPFNYMVKPSAYGIQGVAQTVTVQGMIDCFFKEDGQWVLLDYKTDHYHNSDEKEQIIKRYQLQIDLYAKALSDLTGIPVKEKYLCLIQMCENFRME